ncbi:hypothetical protein SUGI_0015860 [Cryptomeria japonica]|nr:hypothetical protein SUGI_0015860 [Cryptomeria japonica]
MKDPMRPTAKEGITAMEAAPVIIAGLGASASCAFTIITIITTNTAMHSNLTDAPAILSDGNFPDQQIFPKSKILHLFDLSHRFKM